MPARPSALALALTALALAALPVASGLESAAPRWVRGTYWLSQRGEGGRVTLCYVEELADYGRSYVVRCTAWDDSASPERRRSIVYRVGVFDLAVSDVEEDGESTSWGLNLLRFPMYVGRAWERTATRTGADGGLATESGSYAVVATERVPYLRGEEAFVVNATGGFLGRRTYHYVPASGDFPGSSISDLVDEWSSGALPRLASYGRTPIPPEDADADGVPDLAAPLLSVQAEPRPEGGVVLSGRFVDAASGSPVRGMVLRFPGDDRTWSSDSLGRFRVPVTPVEGGALLVSFDHPRPCYERGVVRVSASNGTVSAAAEPEEGCLVAGAQASGGLVELGDVPVWPHASYHVVSDVPVAVSFTVQSNCTGRYQRGTGTRPQALEHVIRSHAQTGHRIRLLLRPEAGEERNATFLIPHAAACDTVVASFRSGELRLAICGNGRCEPGEDPSVCPSDCVGAVCGNGECERGEAASSCPADCNATVSLELEGQGEVLVGRPIELRARFATARGQALEGRCTCRLEEVPRAGQPERPFEGSFEMDLDRATGGYRLSLETRGEGTFRITATCEREGEGASSETLSVRVARAPSPTSVRVELSKLEYGLGESVSLRMGIGLAGDGCDYRLVVEGPGGSSASIGETGPVASCQEHGWGFSTDAVFTSGPGAYRVRVYELTRGLEGSATIYYGRAPQGPTRCLDEAPEGPADGLLLVRSSGGVSLRLGSGSPDAVHGYVTLRDAAALDPRPDGLEGDLDDGCMYGCPCTNDELVSVDGATLRFRLGVCDDSDAFSFGYRVTGPAPAVKVSLKEGSVTVGSSPGSSAETDWLPLCAEGPSLRASTDRPSYARGGEVRITVSSSRASERGPPPEASILRPDGRTVGLELARTSLRCSGPPCQCPQGGEGCDCPGRQCEAAWEGRAVIGRNDPLGTYRVDVASQDEGGGRAAASFEVTGGPIAARALVAVELDRYLLAPDEAVTASARLTDGDKPVLGATLVGTLSVEPQEERQAGVVPAERRPRPVSGQVNFRARGDLYEATFKPPGPGDFNLTVAAELPDGSRATGSASFTVKARLDSGEDLEREALAAARAGRFGDCAVRFLDSAQYWLARREPSPGVVAAVRALVCEELAAPPPAERAGFHHALSDVLARSPRPVGGEEALVARASVLGLAGALDRLAGRGADSAARLDGSSSALAAYLAGACPASEPLCASLDPRVLELAATVQRLSGDEAAARASYSRLALSLASAAKRHCSEEVHPSLCSPSAAELGPDADGSLVFTVENPGPNAVAARSARYIPGSGAQGQCRMAELFLAPGERARVRASCPYAGPGRVELQASCLRLEPSCPTEEHAFGLLAAGRALLLAGSRAEAAMLYRDAAGSILAGSRRADYREQKAVLTFIAARALSEAGDDERARDACRTALGLLEAIADAGQDTAYFAYTGMASCRRALGEGVEADRLMERAEEALSRLGTVNARRFLSGVLAERGELDRARELCREVLVDGLEDDDLHRSLLFGASCLEALGRPDAADAACSIATLVPGEGASTMLSVYGFFPRPLSACPERTLLGAAAAPCGDGRCELGETGLSCCEDCGCPPRSSCSRRVHRCVAGRSLAPDDVASLRAELEALGRLARELSGVARQARALRAASGDAERAEALARVEPALGDAAARLDRLAASLPAGGLDLAGDDADAARGELSLLRTAVGRAASSWRGSR